MMEQLSPRQIANETIRELESRHDLLKYRIGQWSIWPILRFQVFATLSKFPTEPRDPNAFLTRSEQIRQLCQDAAAFLKLRHHRYAISVGSLSLVERNNEFYKDMYFDDLLERIGSFVKIEENFNRSFFIRNEQALFPAQMTILPVLLGSRLLNRLPFFSEYRHEAKAISDCLKEIPSLHNFTEQRILRQIRIFQWMKILHKIILRKITPQRLFLKTAYTNHALVAAARELGIEVIEFQHGIIDIHHAGYSWSSYAIPHKQRIPLPHRIFLYGRFWEIAMRKDGFWDTELIPVGSLRMDQYRLKPLLRSDGCQTLLFTTQNMDADKISRFLAKFVQLASGELDFHLIIKLHPAETTKRTYETHLGSFQQVDILFHNEGASTFELLRRSQYHLSVYSTVHYEAIGLGIPSIVIPFTNYQTVRELYEPGYALLAQLPQHLVEIIKNGTNVSVNQNLSAYLFEPNALENMLHELEMK